MEVMKYRCLCCEAEYTSFDILPDRCVACATSDISIDTQHYKDFAYYVGAFKDTYYVATPVGRHLTCFRAEWSLLDTIECDGVQDIIDIDMWPGTTWISARGAQHDIA